MVLSRTPRSAVITSIRAIAFTLAPLAVLAHCSSGAATNSCTGAACGNDGDPASLSDSGVVTLADGAVVPVSSLDGGSVRAPDGAILPPVIVEPDGAVVSRPIADGGGSSRIVAYVNVTCGFGVGTNSGECLADPDPTVNYVKQWEDDGSSPITHYVLSFLSFQGTSIQTDPGEIWNTGGSTTDFTLVPGVRAALVSAQAHGKKVFLSVGGQNGSSGFLAWWSGLGATSPDRVTAMSTQLQATAAAFATANGVNVDGFDVDIELGGVYTAGSDKYNATRDLIDAVPESFLVAFVPQIGNGLCAAPVVGDPLPPATVLGGQCQQPVNGDDSAWVLAGLDTDCRKSDGTPKLDYWGIQYYNAGEAACCGGGADEPSMIQSTLQNYVDLANGWPASGDLADAASPWHSSEYFPGPWPAFAGIGADRLVLGKPSCNGCAGSDYIDLAGMTQLISGLDGKLAKPAGGILFWDLGRLFGGSTANCVSGACQPSWGGSDAVESNLAAMKTALSGLTVK